MAKKPDTSHLIHGRPTPAHLKRLVGNKSTGLLWEARELSAAGHHELSAVASKAASELERGLAKDATQTLKEAEKMAEDSGLEGTRERMAARRIALAAAREAQEENPTL